MTFALITARRRWQVALLIPAPGEYSLRAGTKTKIIHNGRPVVRPPCPTPPAEGIQHGRRQHRLPEN